MGVHFDKITRQNKIWSQRCSRHAVDKVILQIPSGREKMISRWRLLSKNRGGRDMKRTLGNLSAVAESVQWPFFGNVRLRALELFVKNICMKRQHPTRCKKPD